MSSQNELNIPIRSSQVQQTQESTMPQASQEASVPVDLMEETREDFMATNLLPIEKRTDNAEPNDAESAETVSVSGMTQEQTERLNQQHTQETQETQPEITLDTTKYRPPALPYHYKAEHVPNFFFTARDQCEPLFYQPANIKFGLIPRPYDETMEEVMTNIQYKPTDWQRFVYYIHKLNRDSNQRKSYHILFLGRHGQGFHNLAESWWGTSAWECKWSTLDGDLKSNIKWADADLTKIGIYQAGRMSQDWAQVTREEKMPFPTAFYASPLHRACRTSQLVFQPLVDSGEMLEYKPEIKENLRETIGIHTCDRRSTRSVIAENFPNFKIEEGFTEEDEIWNADFREPLEYQTWRAATAIDEILEGLDSRKNNPFISITAHGGMINSILRMLGHRRFQLNPGSTICVFMKAERADRPRVPCKPEVAIKKPECRHDPNRVVFPSYDSFERYCDYLQEHHRDGVDDDVW